MQTSTVGTKHEASVLERQLESTRKQLQALKEESQRTEAQLRAEVASARGEHSSEVQMLVTKLEESVATYNSSVAEAERMMGAKEELLRKYKDEARAASSKLQSYQVSHPQRLCLWFMIGTRTSNSQAYVCDERL